MSQSTFWLSKDNDLVDLPDMSGENTNQASRPNPPDFNASSTGSTFDPTPANGPSFGQFATRRMRNLKPCGRCSEMQKRCDIDPPYSPALCKDCARAGLRACPPHESRRARDQASDVNEPAANMGPPLTGPPSTHRRDNTRAPQVPVYAASTSGQGGSPSASLGGGHIYGADQLAPVYPQFANAGPPSTFRAAYTPSAYGGGALPPGTSYSAEHCPPTFATNQTYYAQYGGPDLGGNAQGAAQGQAPQWRGGAPGYYNPQ